MRSLKLLLLSGIMIFMITFDSLAQNPYIGQNSDITSFHKEENLPNNTEIVFLETEAYHSFDDLMKQFRGSFVYIDIWATWCKPCLIEFENHEAVDKAIKDKPVKLLYISIDRSKHESRWKRSVEKYDLSCYHLIANRELQKDLWKQIHNQENRVEIPRYLFADQYGKLTIKEAASPSQNETLKQEIERLTKK